MTSLRQGSRAGRATALDYLDPELENVLRRIEACGLTRRYGEQLAVDHLDRTVPSGEILGLLGPNGAGKSTTVRKLTGYVRPTDGAAQLAGFDVGLDPVSAGEHIGIVPEEVNAYADLTVWQNMMLMAELHGIPHGRRTQRGAELAALFDLADRRKQKGRISPTTFATGSRSTWRSAIPKSCSSILG
jgi:ABC-2 type transport system ATP-binding protein